MSSYLIANEPFSIFKCFDEPFVFLPGVDTNPEVYIQRGPPGSYSASILEQEVACSGSDNENRKSSCFATLDRAATASTIV